MPSTLYDIGYKVGKSIIDNRFRKSDRTYLLDVVNGDPQSIGLETATSDLKNIILDCKNYSMFDINILTSGSSVLFYDFVISDTIKTNIKNISGDIFRFVAAQNEEGNLIKFYILNSYVIFENITFTIPDSFSPDLTGYNIEQAAFIYAENSTVKFVNCKFEYVTDNKYVSFVSTVNSTIIYSGCSSITSNMYTLTVTGNPNYPSLLINDNSNFADSVIIYDTSISKWILFS